MIAAVSSRGRDLVDPEMFQRVSARVAAADPQVAELAERIVDQALAFLAAAARQPGAGLVPSALVDLGWHQLILDTHLYTELCQRLGGQFLHHVPDDTPPARSGAVSRSIEAIAAAGYLIDKQVWSSRGDCGQCHEDGHCSNSGADGNENTDTRTKDP
ncbi:hypothetical protein [Actinokineospora inagensis]|uniref:hypothetical protein n=1 Tax=Actinokineospora inagensis TaxID=103730 RepID=UPI000427ADF7|nr:hypothetical protein [Actinokineospora inagensis]